MLFNTILTIIYLLLYALPSSGESQISPDMHCRALVELVQPSFWSPKIVLECVWVAAFSVLGLGTYSFKL